VSDGVALAHKKGTLALVSEAVLRERLSDLEAQVLQGRFSVRSHSQERL
jgi:hypothetical protein